jgi:hypothetical protein
MKNVNAVALGRLGGLVGGPARAASLSPERRREIARQALAARWDPRKRLRRDRVYRRKIAEVVAARSRVDPGDVEHSLYSLTLTPTERLQRCLARR